MNRVSTGIWIAPQIEVLAIAPHPTSFSAIAAQIGVVVMGDRTAQTNSLSRLMVKCSGGN